MAGRTSKVAGSTGLGAAGRGGGGAGVLHATCLDKQQLGLLR
jgi:hypothetical protein